MKEPDASRAERVANPAIAAVFAHPQQRRILLAFSSERSISEVAVLLGLPLARVHYHARRLATLGLLQVARLIRRAGRPIRKYRATSSAYFVPLALLPASPNADLAGLLRAALERQRSRSSGGILFSAGTDGRVDAHRLGDAATADSAELWLVVALTRTEARSLAESMRALLRRYSARPARGKGRRPHLVYAAVAPRADG